MSRIATLTVTFANGKPRQYPLTAATAAAAGECVAKHAPNWLRQSVELAVSDDASGRVVLRGANVAALAPTASKAGKAPEKAPVVASAPAPTERPARDPRPAIVDGVSVPKRRRDGALYTDPSRKAYAKAFKALVKAGHNQASAGNQARKALQVA